MVGSTYRTDGKKDGVDTSRGRLAAFKSVAASTAIIAALGAASIKCGSDDSNPVEVPNTVSDAGMDADGTGGSSGSSGAGGSSGSSGSSGAGGSAGQKDAGASCPVTVAYNLDCKSLTSVVETLEVGKSVGLGTKWGPFDIKVTGVSGSNFEFAKLHATSEKCETTTPDPEVQEGTSQVVSAGTAKVGVKVYSVAPDPVNGKTFVEAEFSSICTEQTDGGMDGGADAAPDADASARAVCVDLGEAKSSTAVVYDVGQEVSKGGVKFKIVSSDTTKSTVGLSCVAGGDLAAQVAVPAAGKGTYDLGTYTAEMTSVWSNPVQVKMTISVVAK